MGWLGFILPFPLKRNYNRTHTHTHGHTQTDTFTFHQLAGAWLIHYQDKYFCSYLLVGLPRTRQDLKRDKKGPDCRSKMKKNANHKTVERSFLPEKPWLVSWKENNKSQISIT